MIVSNVQYFHEFSLLFLELQFLSKYGILKPVLGEIDFFKFFDICQ